MVSAAFRSLLAALLAAALAAAQDDDLRAQLEELRQRGDDAGVELIDKIAAARSRAAATGLIAAFDSVHSILMQRAIANALGSLADVAEAEQPALQKLADVALASPPPEVLAAAIAGLGHSTGFGRSLLRRIVDGSAPDHVREVALRAHVANATAADADWYRYLWNLKREQRKNADGTIQGLELPSIRELAFQGLREQLSADDLIATLRNEIDPKIRRAALNTMHARDLPQTAEQARWLLERVDFPGADRAVAAQILVAREGARATTAFLELAKKRDVTPEDLRDEMARLLAGLGDEATDKKLVKLVGKGKPHEQVFALRATMRIDDPKLVAAIRKQLKDKEPEIRQAAAMALGARKDQDSLPDLRQLLAKPRSPADPRIAIEAISLIEQGRSGWLDELAALAAAPDRDTRNAALEQLVEARKGKYLPVLLAALQHDDWTTRLCAIDGVVALREPQVVPRLIDRLEHERGRMAKALGAALWQLTARPYGEDLAQWRAWWQAEGASFALATAAELEAAAQRRERQRLLQRTSSGAQFFGIRIESHRVIFVLDVSGSMLESVYGRTFGKWGAARIDVAKQELRQAIERLDEGALFNVFAFTDGVARWRPDRIGVSTAADRAAALEWVARLGAAGGTNLYDSLQQAFADPDVDTIFVMSDGEPTSGAVIDPHRIRQDVAEWNRHRRIVIHTVAIGGSLEVLEWLAADAGGRHVRIR